MELSRAIEILKQADIAYENGDEKQILTDDQYDKLRKKVYDACPNHEYFQNIGGLGCHPYDSTVTHTIPMGSLLKKESIDSFCKWVEFTFGKDEEIQYLLEHKVDGLALSLTYDNGVLQKAVTRGNGIIGKDVTPNALYIPDIPRFILHRGKVEVRGEVFKDRQEFLEHDIGVFKTARNFAAGALRQKDPTITGFRKISFIAYEVLLKDFETQLEKIKFLAINKFKHINSKSGRGKAEQVCNAAKIYYNEVLKSRDSLPYDIDGIVFKLNCIKQLKSLGYRNEGRIPLGNMAIKFPTASKTVAIKDIVYDIGCKGQLTAVAIFEPIILLNCEHTRVTLHNPKFIKINNIVKGSVVRIEKRGDIIPYISEVLSSPAGSIAKIPETCPSCNNPLKWNKNNVTLLCHNSDCPSILYKRIDKFFTKLNVKGIAKKTCEKIVKTFNIKTLDKIFDIKVTDLQKLFGNVQGRNVYNSIHGIKDKTLYSILRALSLGNMGLLISEVTNIAPTIDKIDSLTIDDIKQLEGWGETSASAFIKDWRKHKSMILSLVNKIGLSTEKEVRLHESEFGKLKGLKFRFTGSFQNPTRKEMEELVKLGGGKIASVSKSLDYLVWDEVIDTNNIKKARKLGLKILTQKEFLNMLGDHQ